MKFLLFLVLLTIKSSLTANSSRSNSSGSVEQSFGCLNEKGQFVDWWFIYKQSDGLSYVYLDSSLTVPLPLSKSRKIDCPESSPLVRTVTSARFPQAQPRVNSTDEPFYVAWNDQQRKSTASANSQSNSKKAHSKGFMGLKANEGRVESFFIQHTLPRFPVIPSESLTEDYSMFDSNASSSAQHFLCLSMQDRAQDVEANYYKLLQNYSSVAKAAFFGYNYQWEESSWLARGLKALIVNRSSVPSVPSVTQFTIQSTGQVDVQLQLTVICKSASYEADLYDDMTALLSIDHRHYTLDESSPAVATIDFAEILTTPPDTYNSLMIVQSYVDPSLLGVNQKIIIEDRKNVLNSVLVQIANSNWVLLPEETNEAGEISSAYKLNCNDESDTEETGASSRTEGNVADDVSTATPMPPASSSHSSPYYLSDSVAERLTSEFKATIQACRPQISLYKDHSKWSVNIRTGDKGPFYPLLCFYDLNRTSKQSRRGGAAFCLNSSLTGVNPAGLKLWSFFLSLRPKPLDAAKFTNKAPLEVASALFTRSKGATSPFQAGLFTSSATCPSLASCSSSTSFESPNPLATTFTRTLTRTRSIVSDLNPSQKFIAVLPLLSVSKKHALESADESADSVPILKEFIDFRGQDYLVSVHFRSQYYGSVPCPFKFADKTSFTAKTDLRDSLQVARFIIQKGWQEVLRIGKQFKAINTIPAESIPSSARKTPKETKPHRYAFNQVQPCTVRKEKEEGSGAVEFDLWERYLHK